MQQNTNEIELISVSEMREYLAQTDHDFHDCQYLLQGWMELVAPLTPSSVEGIASLKCVQDITVPGNVEHVPESVIMLLAALALSDVFGARLSADTVPLVSQAWPTFWTWTQYIYSAYLHVLDSNMDANPARYQVFVKILQMFSVHEAEPMVSEIIENHPGVLIMMADMWIREGTDKRAQNGFRCAEFINFQNGNTETPFLVQLVITCGAEEAVYIACQRIERHLGQAQREYHNLIKDLSFFTRHLSRGSISPFGPKMYASSQVAIILMRAWAHIISVSCTASDKLRCELLHVCLFAIFKLVQRSPQAYDRILEVLHQDLLPLLMKSVSLGLSTELLPTQEYFTACTTAIIRDVLSPATVHRRVLSLVGRYVDVVSKSEDAQALKKPGEIADSWSSLLEVLDEREKVFRMFKESPGNLLVCGNFKCNSPDGVMLRRCSACRISLYCSRKCQREHWHSHRALCKDMVVHVEGCIDMSYPDLHFLSYLVAYDIMVHHRNKIAPIERRSDFGDATPFFLLNYIRLEGYVSICHVIDIRNRQPLLPFSFDHPLYKEWLHPFEEAEGDIIPVLVAIPRGHNFWMMTASAHISDFHNLETRPTQDLMQLVGIRWLHLSA